MTGYTKLFNSILASTIWDEDKDTKILWITMLAMSDMQGKIEASIPGLAHLARIGVPETEAGLKKLLASDPYSRTKEHDGRRIAEIDGGWLILNRAKYREKMTADERREYRAEWMRNKRKDEREQSVNSREQTCTVLTQKEVEVEVEKEKSKSKAGAHAPTNPTLQQVIDYCKERNNAVNAQQWHDYYCSNGWKVGRNAMKDWKAAVRRWERNGNGNATHPAITGNVMDRFKAGA